MAALLTAVISDYSQVMATATTDAPADERALIKQAQRSDARAFEGLYKMHVDRVYGICLRMTGNVSEAEDCAQDAFIQAWNKMDKFRGDSAFYTWLYRIAINTAKNYLVSRSRRPPGSDVEIEDAEYYASGGALHEIETPESALFGAELKQVVERAIKNLPEDLRTAVTLREFDGLSYEDIADIMDCPVGTVRSRIFRAREAIDGQVREQLDGDT